MEGGGTKEVQLFESFDEAQSFILENRSPLNKYKVEEKTGIPDAPFRKDWAVQLFKRALRDAVESGKSWIGWTTGIEQIKRYEETLRQQVKSIEWTTEDGLTIVDVQPTKGKRIYLPVKNGKIYRTADQQSLVGKDLAEVIGKEATAKVNESSSGKLTGDDLTIGGEGMKGFYDQILPKEIGKYVSKMGGKVEKSGIVTERASTFTQFIPPRRRTPNTVPKTTYIPEKVTPIWRVNITPEMENVVRAGQIQFMPAEAEGAMPAEPQGMAGVEAPQTYRRISDMIPPLQGVEPPVRGRVEEPQPALSGLAMPAGQIQFMPARPIRKTEPLPDFETTIIKGVTPSKGFKWDKETNVELDIGGGRTMSFSYDPKYLEKPEFKDLIKELKGQPVILLEADRQRATGGDMGGPLHPFLKSNQVTITGPDGKKYKAVWANMTSTFVSGAKNRLASHGAKYALVHLMDPIAHKSNKRTARTLDKMMRKSKLSQREKEIISLSMQAGIIAGDKSAMSSAITALKRQMSSAKKDPEKIRIINEKINKITKEREDITPKGFYGEIFKAVSSIKKAISNVKTGNWAENSIEKANKKLEKYVNIKEYNELLKNNKSLYISDNIGNTFSDRGSAIGSILSFKFGKFDPSLVMRESSDFREGENLDIVTAVELSQNPDIFALYFGKDPKEEAAMSTAERKARDEMRANPDFVEHEAYDWVMLGPEKGNNFLVKNPVKPEQIFKKYRETHAGETVVDGSAETVAGAMRKNAGFILRVDEDTQKVLASKKKNK
jgi:hypothetical protein